MKKRTAKILTPLSAVGAVFALGMSGASAQTTPVYDYNFPASWSGTGTTITDTSTAANNGSTDGTLATAAAPSGASGNSVNTATGAILTGAAESLANATVAADGGFTYETEFMWNGSFSTSFSSTQKILDYAGTESLQIIATSGTSATLEMVFGGNSSLEPNVPETVASSTTILPNTWYNVFLTFNTTGNTVDGSGNLAGIETMYVNGIELPPVAATKGNYGDVLDRPIGVGQLGANFGYLVGFKGDIYDSAVDLGVAVPEPTSTALLGVSGALAMVWNLRRRKQ